MLEISQEAKMIIASNLTIAAFIREAAVMMKGGSPEGDSNKLVTQTFATILTNLEKQALGAEQKR